MTFPTEQEKREALRQALGPFLISTMEEEPTFWHFDLDATIHALVEDAIMVPDIWVIQAATKTFVMHEGHIMHEADGYHGQPGEAVAIIVGRRKKQNDQTTS